MKDQYYDNMYENAENAAEQDDALENEVWKATSEDKILSIYEFLKTHTARKLFIQEKQDYLTRSFGIKSAIYIRGEILELEKVINHERLQREEDSCLLYCEAVTYATNVFVKENKELEQNTHHLLKELYVYHLLKNDFFENVEVPDEAIGLDDTIVNYIIIPMVYSRYFLFYDYLKKELATIKTESESLNGTKALQNKKKEVQYKIENFYELFFEIHKTKYDKIIDLLAHELPPLVTKEYDDISGPFIEIINNDKQNVQWISPLGQKYIAGLFFVCRKRKWVKEVAGSTKLQVIASKTFKIEIGSHSIFSKMEQNLDSKYFKPFELLLKDIK